MNILKRFYCLVCVDKHYSLFELVMIGLIASLARSADDPLAKVIIFVFGILIAATLSLVAESMGNYWKEKNNVR